MPLIEPGATPEPAVPVRVMKRPEPAVAGSPGLPKGASSSVNDSCAFAVSFGDGGRNVTVTTHDAFVESACVHVLLFIENWAAPTPEIDALVGSSDAGPSLVIVTLSVTGCSDWLANCREFAETVRTRYGAVAWYEMNPNIAGARRSQCVSKRAENVSTLPDASKVAWSMVKRAATWLHPRPSPWIVETSRRRRGPLDILVRARCQFPADRRSETRQRTGPRRWQRLKYAWVFVAKFDVTVVNEWGWPWPM